MVSFEYFKLLQYIYTYGEKIDINGSICKEINWIDLVVNLANYPYTENVRAFDKTFEYEKAELCWYWSGVRNNEFIKPYASLWGKIENADGTANSNYGDLVYYRKTNQMSSFEWALYNLEKDKNTRKALVLYNSRDFNYKNNKDYICSQLQHFMIRDNKLICGIYLRSSDAIFGLQYNMPWWSLVQQDMYLRLKKKYSNLELGHIMVKIGSSHIYERHFNLVKKMLNDKQHYKTITLKKPISLNLVNDPRFYQSRLSDFINVA